MTTTAATFDLDRVFAALAPIRKPKPPARPRNAVSAASPLSAPSLDGTTLKEDDGDMTMKREAKGAARKTRERRRVSEKNITVVKNADGSSSYRVQFRIRVDGKQISKTETFSTLKTAKTWRDRTRAEIELNGIPRPTTGGPRVRDAILRRLEVHKTLGRSTRQMLTNIADRPFGQVETASLTKEVLIEFAESLSAEEKQPQTVAGYMTTLAKTLNWASDRGFPAPEDALRKAMGMLWEDEVLAKSEARERRPSLDELDRILEALTSNKRQRLPVASVIVFAVFSCRRLGEICRLRWEDLRIGNKEILVRDMKHPKHKKGNDVWCTLTDEALAIILAMPRTSEFIFPFKPTSIGTAFQRHRDRVEIEDLRFHDLRHEAVSRLFELGQTAWFVKRHSGHKTMASLERYEHVEKHGDKFEGWSWLSRVIEAEGRL